jgi:hypothetical protein
MGIKIAFIGLIFLSAFIDFQISILLAIAFFVSMINLNRDQILSSIAMTTVTTQQETPPPKPAYLYNSNKDFENSFTYPENSMIQTNKLDKMDKLYKADIVPYVGETMHNFPEVACNTKRFEDTEISKDMMTYFIDEKTKPYEVYIRMLTNDENLRNVQNNTFTIHHKE